jgi:acetyl-CoA carboxylase carboxyl transferase subunit alpha
MRKIAGEFEKPLAELEDKIADLESFPESPDRKNKLEALERELAEKREEIFADLSCWERTLLARAPSRPYTYDYIKLIFDEFIEFHGDRRFAEDPALVCGFAIFKGEPVCVIGHQKGRGTKEKLHHNFGMPNPEGYRKAMRIMQLADKFKRPIFTFVDTPGAYPGIGAEERGQAEAIAYNLKEMGKLTVPVIVTVIGEGGSGGALAIAIGNKINMLQNSIYSVITPEGCAAILWKDAAYANKAANAMKLSSADLESLDLVDEVIPEPPGGAHIDHEATASILSEVLSRDLENLSKLNDEELLEDRFQKFRKMGKFLEETSVESA